MKILFYFIHFILISRIVFAEFEASIYIPLGINYSYPNINTKEKVIRDIYLDTMKFSYYFNIGVTGNFGYKFNINKNKAVSILTEIGYSRLDFKSSFKVGGNRYNYYANQNLVFHTLNIGIMPKYCINMSALINPDYNGRVDLCIGIGFGMKIALAGEYYNTMNDYDNSNYKSHLVEKYSFKDIKRKFDYPFIPYIKFQIEDHFYLNENIAFLFGVSLTYNFGIFYDIENMSYEDAKRNYEKRNNSLGIPVSPFLYFPYSIYNIKKYGFSSFEIALNFGIKFRN